jgi:hypothetical protein
MVANRPDDEATVLPPQPERSVSALFSDLARETTRLFRQEVALVKAETLGKLGQMGAGAAELVAGGLVIYAGFLALLAAATLGLAHVLAAWLAALIVGVVAILVGAGVVLKGRRDVKPRNLVPGRTLRTLRADAEWAREQMR